jgi:integrase
VERAFESYLDTIPRSKRLSSLTYELKDAVGKTGFGFATARAGDRAAAARRCWSTVLAENGGLVFTEPDGRPLSPEQFSTNFRRLVRTLGLPTIRVHDLRHTNATLLRLGGADTVTISRLLGHASLAITERYVHQLDEQSRSAVTGAGDLLRAQRAQLL